MRYNKGFIQVSILIAIVACVLVVGGVVYIGVEQYQRYQAEKSEKGKLAEENKKMEEEKRLKLQKLIESQNEELEKQKADIENLKNKPSVIIQNPEENSKPSAPIDSVMSLADLIEFWSPNIAKINCLSDLNKSPGGNAIKPLLIRYGVDTEPVTVSGSGFLILVNTSYSGPEIIILTNRHVVNTHNGYAIPYYCEAVLPGGYKYFFDNNDLNFVTTNSETKYINSKPFNVYEVDAAFFIIKNPDTYSANLAKAKASLTCTETPRIGDDVIILGYPTIGSAEGITATDGIISGLEESYFITSAKIEQGNSGGAAILKNKNCYLGIPTFARTGSVESLARILSFKKIFK